MSGINYLIREPHYEENCYKIGTSSSETIKRVCDYKKGTQILCILKSNNSSETEKLIKQKFSSLFTLTSVRILLWRWIWSDEDLYWYNYGV